MEVQWTPRDRNQEADDLSNLRTGRLRSRERGEGGLGGSKLVRSAPAAGERSELPRREVLEQEEEEGREVEVQGEMASVRGGSGKEKEQGEERDRRNRRCAELEWSKSGEKNFTW